ncbi:dephospho-CoA kinase [Vulgatibacter sp.]|uniref:dephospho-CoA kinase n=1 Tax=Vulgatibacter sp. TaxID=1971226 RepID=UPI00356A3E81
MQRIGLTGGIASGKSTVARLLAARGVPVIDADALAREVVAPGSEGLAAIAARWPQVVRDGVLDRKALGALVFAAPAERLALEAITHPRIRAESTRRMAAAERAGAQQVVYEAALLFENDLDRGLDGTILVAADPALQVERLQGRDGLSAEEAEARLRAQLPLAEKKARATWVIDNSGDLEALRRRVDEVWAEVVRRT